MAETIIEVRRLKIRETVRNWYKSNGGKNPEEDTPLLSKSLENYLRDRAFSDEEIQYASSYFLEVGKSFGVW